MCKNCNHPGCYAVVWCSGCEMTLCWSCYKEHNGVHFDETINHPYCCCDACIDRTIEKNRVEETVEFFKKVDKANRRARNE